MMDLAALDEMEVESEVFDPLERQRDEWMAKRSGRFTCSKFGDLIGEGRKKDQVFSEKGLRYLRLKVAERLGSWHSISARSMEWGTDNEAAAIRCYEARTGLQVASEPFQFIEVDDWIGGTPDGLVGDDGCIEVKCPFDPQVHVNTALTRQVPVEYVWQVLGHLLVTGRDWCDFVSYDPRIVDKAGLVVIRVDRDEKRIEFLRERLNLAVDQCKLMLKALGK
jgi:hypothetical protein